MSHSLRRVAKNAAVPMIANLFNKVLDLGFAIFMLRELGPTDIGRYTWAVLVVGYFDILVNYGLGVLITREVARDPSAGDRYLGAALLTRVGLWVACVASALVIAGPGSAPLGLTVEMGLTLVLLTVGIGISNLAGLLSALFSARERMEFPAYVTVFTTVAKVGLGVPALLLGYGIVGIAVVAIVVNLMTAVVLIGLFHRIAGGPHPESDRGLSVNLLRTSYPLMLNNLLATVFFRVDGLILRATWGDTALGWYGTAYKFIDGLNVIPSSVTLAVFPVLSRLGQPGSSPHDREPLVRATELVLKALLALAFPLAVGTTLLAGPVIQILAGEAFLPHAAIALQILIWFVPFSFTNGLLQYVLIASDRQRFVTTSFLGAVGFNLVANLLIIPVWSYVGAAVVTILSEVVLLGFFLWAVGRQGVRVRLAHLSWRPVVAAAAMAPVVWALQTSLVAAVALGGAVYVGAFLALGGFSKDERTLLARILTRSPPDGAGGRDR